MIRFAPAVALALTLALGSTAALAAPLTEQETKAALDGLADEYHAFSFYQAVIAKFGPERPFRNIVKAEQRHIDRIVAVLNAAGVAVPANPYEAGTLPLPAVPDSLAAACAAGVAAEMANDALYNDRLLPAVTGNAELTAVFTALRDASQMNHLPAFQRCAG